MNRIEGIAQFNTSMNKKQDYFITFKRIENKPTLEMLHLNREDTNSMWEKYEHISRAKGYTEFRLEFIYD